MRDFLIALLIFLGIIVLFFTIAVIFIDKATNQPQFGKYKGWQSVYLLEKWAFKVPEEWFVTWEDNVLHITDKPMEEDDFKHYLIGVVEPNYRGEEYISILSEFFGDLKYERWLQDSINMGGSLGERYGSDVYSVNGNEIIIKEISFALSRYGESEDDIRLAALDVSLDDHMMLKIMQSFGDGKSQAVKDFEFFARYTVLLSLLTIITVSLVLLIRSQRKQKAEEK